MSRRFLILLVGLCLLGSALTGSAAASRFYTPDYGSKTPEVIGGFDLGADGSLTSIQGSPFPAAQPGFGGLFDLAFNPDGTRAVTGYFFTGGIQGFRVPDSGVFERASPSPSASTTAVAISPDGRFAYGSTREFGGMMAEGIRVYAIEADGSLAPRSSGGSGEYRDVALTPDGRFLFATASGGIERFAVAPDGSLSYLGTTPAPSGYLLSMAPDGRFLFVLVMGGSAGGFTSFAVGADGGLQQVGDPALVADSFPRLSAMAPDGRHLYLADSNGDGAIHTFAIGVDGAPAVVART
ncbi:MAG TPA: beta-propeller fold lactonase family protein, partial [Solirubrobacterales bacterium]